MTDVQAAYLSGVRRAFIALAGSRLIGAGFDRFDVPVAVRYSLLPPLVWGALAWMFGTRLERLDT